METGENAAANLSKGAGVVFVGKEHTESWKNGDTTLLEGTTNRSITDKAAKQVVVARHPTRDVIGVLLVDIESIDGQQAISVAAIAVDENFRHMGVASTLPDCVHRIVPAPRVMVGGMGPPDFAPFFAQAGFTVLRPGVTLPVAIGNQYRHHKGVEDKCWSYRQTGI
ncbi:hypothetical protein [Curtobacterium flaccumfaciens]|uniref:hypothetical protein n=1 Tax=Curtobacterium flaccumfaciens TaxID=2035 RepID=UPI0013675271|nr:hypothetical protein [Curtobacterium flaccumfaciens]MBT1667317.1 hypothetical protein [Curtobacterium flaccumfaciens pv. flaccumfaciens]QHN62892.1 hypothetical protein GBG65_19875 [Curtobacterium flaccumfaciens pv. flaccumfaciens]